MKKPPQKLPRFKTEAEERSFWEHRDSTEYIDWKKAKQIKFTRLKPSLRTISIRLPESVIEDLKVLANKRDVPYQSLLKLLLDQQIRKELQDNKATSSASA